MNAVFLATRLCCLSACAVVTVVVASACTLLLDTSKIVQPCTSGADCKAGFDCIDNACLPQDDGSDPSQ